MTGARSSNDCKEEAASANPASVVERQKSLARHLRDPGSAPAPDGVETRRLQVYRDLVYRNIEGFISSGFPVLRSLFDDACWEALVREFIRDHRCHSPLFLKISEEFLAFLAGREADAERPFMAELAHYEWLELAVDVAEGEVPDARVIDDPAPLVPRLSPTARVGSYHYAVHRIGRSYQPVEADTPAHLLVYRNREDRVQFMELSPGAARLLHEVSSDGTRSAAELLLSLASEWGLEETSTLQFGLQQLQQFAQLGAVDFSAKGVE